MKPDGAFAQNCTDTLTHSSNHRSSCKLYANGSRCRLPAQGLLELKDLRTAFQVDVPSLVRTHHSVEVKSSTEASKGASKRQPLK